MALIRTLVKEGLTGLYYVKNGADSRKSSLIDRTQDEMATLAILWPNLAKYVFNYNFWRGQFYKPILCKKGWRFQKKQSY